jgi:hypothetical protein
VEVEAKLNPTATETDAAPDDHVGERQVGPSTSVLLNPNTPAAQQKSLVPLYPEDICPVSRRRETNSNRDRKASSGALTTNLLAQGQKKVEKSHARGAPEENSSKDPVWARISR